MKTFHSLISIVSVLALLTTFVPPAEAAFRNASPRGLRRSISRAREGLKEKCKGIEDADEKRQCMRDYRNKIRGEAKPVRLKQVYSPCSHLDSESARRACSRDRRSEPLQGAKRKFNKRTRTRAVKAMQEECREKSTKEERLQCLKDQGGKRRSRVRQLIKRSAIIESTSTEFNTTSGLRRNIRRTRDLITKECDPILDGNAKRQCIKHIKAKYEGY